MLVPYRDDIVTSAAPLPRRLAIFGATGSIGQSALEIVHQHPDRFSVFALVAGKNWRELSKLAHKFHPKYVALDSAPTEKVDLPEGTELLVGTEQICELARSPEYEMMLAAIVGFAGLPSLLAAIQSKKLIALANKESLVCAGDLIRRELEQANSKLLPVDSEHSAIFQALHGENVQQIQSLILTASGGPFLHLAKNQFSSVTPEMALKHPNWSMGPKVTIDSSTLVNKALELIEAHFLFDVAPTKIEVLVHPQSIIHSLIRFVDGTQMAQLSKPSMKGPIAYALNYPCGRLDKVMDQLELADVGKLEFYKLDDNKFPAVRLARHALQSSNAMPGIFSVANEICVNAFLAGNLGFEQIVPRIEKTLGKFSGKSYSNFNELESILSEVRSELLI